MQAVSVVIIAKNEAHLLAQTLQSVKKITDDILVCDTGSSDATIPIARKNGATVIEEVWKGYGTTKNIANEHAVYDWILQLDADEEVDPELVQSILALDLKDEKIIYTVKRKNFFKQKWIRFGEWWNDEPIRLFNRNQAAWNDDVVHERLIYGKDCTTVRLKGAILHRTFQSTIQFKAKIKDYAIKSGEKYFAQGKSGAWYKQFFSPLLSFVKNFIFKLGFLDSPEGFKLASMRAGYTKIKYQTLRKLQREQRKKT